MDIQLTKYQQDRLLELDPAIKRNGGFQQFAIKLQQNVNTRTGVLTVTEQDIERARTYVTQYGEGGWQDLYREIFKGLL